MANAWIAHVKKTREMYPQIMQKGGLRAIILKAKETYKKQSGGSGHPMGGKVETMVDQGAQVAGVSMGRAVGAGAHENAKLENAHTMGGGKKGKRGGDSHDEGPEPVGDDVEHKGPEDEGHEDKDDKDKDDEDDTHVVSADKPDAPHSVPVGGKKSKKGKKTKKAKKSKKSKTAKKGGKKTKKVKKAKKAKKAKKTRSRK
tara:strand:+ start:211 stop:810 length:600 start_codon:yes stop_codon:yes gene_type:complete